MRHATPICIVPVRAFLWWNLLTLQAAVVVNRHGVIEQDMIKLLQGDERFFLNWTVLKLWHARNTNIANGTRIAGIGALISMVLTCVFAPDIPIFIFLICAIVCFYQSEVATLIENLERS